MLALSKAKATAYNTRVLVRATCELDGELFSKCTVEFSGAVFKSELQPIKGDPTALEKRATELARPKFIAHRSRRRWRNREHTASEASYTQGTRADWRGLLQTSPLQHPEWIQTRRGKRIQRRERNPTTCKGHENGGFGAGE